MERSAAILLCCILLFIFLIIENSSASQNELLQNELHLIHDQIGFLMNENRNHNVEMNLMKEMLATHDKMVHQKIIQELDQRMKQFLTNNDHQDHSPPEMARQKRPFRLLPLTKNSGDGSLNNQQRSFYGPPTNCSDLSRLGYTLNGFYTVTISSVNLSITINDASKLETVYCSFKQPEGTFNPSAGEKRIPRLKLDYSSNNVARPVVAGIHFQVIRTQKLVGNNPPIEQFINFDRVHLNLGDIIVQGNGLKVVIAPKSGVYQFAFTSIIYGIAKQASSSMIVELYRMGSNNDGEVVGKSSAVAAGNSMSIAATLKLAKCDKMVLVATQGNGYEIGWASFSGSLLEEL